VVDALGKTVARPRQSELPALLGLDPIPGQDLLKLRLDPYDVSFGYVSTHLLVRSAAEKECFGALAHGRCYVAFDWLADPTGFRFTGHVDRGSKQTDRGEVEMGEKTKRRPVLLEAETPIPAELRLLRDGREIARESGSRLTDEVSEAGVYRVEAWLTVAGQPRPWIYSNPIFLRSRER
jgi:hypothetical protein